MQAIKYVKPPKMSDVLHGGVSTTWNRLHHIVGYVYRERHQFRHDESMPEKRKTSYLQQTHAVSHRRHIQVRPDVLGQLRHVRLTKPAGHALLEVMYTYRGSRVVSNTSDPDEFRCGVPCSTMLQRWLRHSQKRCVKKPTLCSASIPTSTEARLQFCTRHVKIGYNKVVQNSNSRTYQVLVQRTFGSLPRSCCAG